MPVYDLVLGGDGDIYLSVTGDLAVTAPDRDGIAQHVLQRLRLFRGELAWAPTEGVPYFQVILVKNPNPAAIRAALIDVILGTPGVTSVDRLDMKIDPPTRTLTVGFSANSNAGLLAGSITL